MPDEWQGRTLLLHFGGVDWRADVWVNGRVAGRHEGGYSAFSFDITPFLVSPGMQDLVLAVDDPPESDADGWQPRGKQRAGCGIWYTRTTGIWQPVWLEAVHSVHVRSVDLRTDLTRRRLLVTAECTREADLDVAVSLGHSEVAARPDAARSRWSCQRSTRGALTIRSSTT